MLRRSHRVRAAVKVCDLVQPLLHLLHLLRLLHLLHLHTHYTYYALLYLLLYAYYVKVCDLVQPLWVDTSKSEPLHKQLSRRMSGLLSKPGEKPAALM